MNLKEITDLFARSTSEEDVKKALTVLFGIPANDYTQGQVDIRIGNRIWLEAKHTETPLAHILSQALWYVRDAQSKSLEIPMWIGVFDRSKIGFIETSKCLVLLSRFESDDLKKPASGVVKNAPAFVEAIKAEVLNEVRVFSIKTESESAREFYRSIKDGSPPHIAITAKNFRRVFFEWQAAVGCEISGLKKTTIDPSVLVSLFLADATTGVDYRADVSTEVIPPATSRSKIMFVVGDDVYKSNAARSYTAFWSKYTQIPNRSEYDAVVANKDELMDEVSRSRTGAFFTPIRLVHKAYEYLTHTLGTDWMKEYIVWDPCAGTGNLLIPHPDPSRVFMSTLLDEDVRSMKSLPVFAGAQIFQYDYLNDDIAPDGSIDYSLTNKMPRELQELIRTGAKILILMNPPYTEATSHAGTTNRKDKSGVAKTAVADKLMKKDWGLASNETYAQFIARVYKELPTSKLAMFSTLKHLNSTNFAKFREYFLAEYLGGCVIEANIFEGVNGKYPIGFGVWDLGVKTPMSVLKADVLNKSCEIVGEKSFYALDPKTYLNKWIDRPRANPDLKVVPLGNAVSVYKSKPAVLTGTEGMLGYMLCNSNDLQSAGTMTALLSSPIGGGHGFYITPENLWQAAVVFTVRRVIKPTWLNDRDQFLQPTSELSDEFKTDCLIWMLFNGSNLSASADLEYESKNWEVKNHFVPFTEIEMGLDASSPLESRFMVNYLKGLVLSPEASNLMQEGLKLFTLYHELKLTGGVSRSLRDEYRIKSGCSEGWYQIRNILERVEGKGFDNSLKQARATLTEKLTPLIFEYGFLKE